MGVAGRIRSGQRGWFTGAWPTRRRTRAQTGTAASSNAIPTESPADLYSNSTIALDPDTGKLRWYYQHLPGDDWDEDYANERTLLRTTFNPDPKFVKWINPDVKRGEQRDVAVMVGEGGGIFVIDRGQRSVPLGESVSVRHARLPDLEHRRQDRTRAL